MYTNTDRYPAALRHLHWLIAILMLITMGCILAATGIKIFFAPERGTPLGDLRSSLFFAHETAAFFVLIFSVIRILFSFKYRHQKPASLNKKASIEWLAEQTVHFMLQYAVLVLIWFGWATVSAKGFTFKLFNSYEMPALSGTIDLFATPSFFYSLLLEYDAHKIMGYAFIVLTGMHIGGAIFHHFIKKEPILQRML